MVAASAMGGIMNGSEDDCLLLRPSCLLHARELDLSRDWPLAAASRRERKSGGDWREEMRRNWGRVDTGTGG